VVNVALHRLPAFAEEIADREEGADPQERARVGEGRELMRPNLRHARDICSEVTHARNEIAEREPPVADPLKPGMRLLDVFLPDPHISPVAVDEHQPETASQPVADCDAGDAACECGEQSQWQREVTLIDQVAAEGQHGLVGNRQSDDPKDEKEKNRDIAVLRDPGEDVLFHAG